MRSLCAAGFVLAAGCAPVHTGAPLGLHAPTKAVVEPTFESIKQNIFIPKCSSCHKPGGEASRVALDSVQAMIDSPLEIVLPGNPEESGLWLVLQPGARKPMPPLKSGLAALEDSEKRAVWTWIEGL